MARNQPRAKELLREYGMGHEGVAPGEALANAATDVTFRWPTRLFAEAHQGSTHFYELDWRSPALNGALGAAHSVALPFVFNTLAAASGPEGLLGENPPQTLADRTHGIWVRFAKAGDLDWLEFDAKTRQVFFLGANETRHKPPLRAAALTY